MADAEPAQPSSLFLKPTNLECKNLYDYLKTRSSATLEKLYNHPTICLAVYRELPELARQYVIRILFVEQPVPQAVVASWGAQAFSKEHVYVSKVLSELSVWQEAAIPGGLLGWILSVTFKKNLKIALLGGGKPWSMSSALEVDSKARDVSFLDAYSLERWECVLHYMVGSQQQEGISADAVRILLHAGLMKRDEEDGSPVITRQGFQFLLLDRQAQVWHFLLQYLDTVEQRGLSLVECLTFLFQLSFSTLGKDYSTEGMSPGLLIFLQHLREFGLVYQRKRKAGRFYPTRLALNITCSQGPETRILEEDTPKGYIIVETNYRVYAYTDSNLQVALIGLFTELMYRFPNLVVGVITRDSIRQALKGGITADQIIGYLKQHAHPQMLEGEAKHPLPPTVVDQIKLWEIERNRLTYSEGVLYSQFLSQADFNILKEYAQSNGHLIWCNKEKRTLIINKSAHDDVKKFWKRYSKGN
ncbi:general transcription factor IIH subunit 4 [Tribolium castaneum]|uniref:General transcription factor IIH subunit 4 n=1 Tax=Tribolium castaneum TaxID=7070 RepID=D6WU09_TRICA|nr:PREDICTED: general transcription factor IIH subunit 4 [Tribolium castaneum]XP_971121.1 PREDICTED: general transcription factor IIH subunit 4 [Tribolium castaneum]EFA07302.1 General transcription factor IIH subunit 4-like Protein [Tribolium castaneum]|eukprot:XP_008200172.1 PREDICTED: general transcription factor IIH subunit 4 [Tribolium castaneum]